MRQTVLEKCGISKELVEFLKEKGLIVPAEVKETEKPLISPSEEWFCSIADKFTPPLSNSEREAIKRIPFLLSLKLLSSEHTAIDTAFILYKALERVKNLETPEEKVAAILCILRIFHGALDYNILKYDRHLDYHEYEESPVGYVWKRFKELLSKAAPQDVDKEEWVNQKSLEILSAPKRVHFTQEYYFACREARKMLEEKIPELDKLSEREILKRLKDDYILKILEEFSRGFYKELDEFIRDVLLFKDSDFLRRLKDSKMKSKKVLEEVCSRLSEEDAFELERVIEILEEFISIQEWEGSFGAGIHFGNKMRIWDVLIRGYYELKTLLKDNIHLINPEVKDKVLELLKAEDIPSIFVANREIIRNIDKFFNKDVREIFNLEIQRWT